MFALNKRDSWPCLLISVVLAFTAWQLHHQGRQWWCDCRSFLWTSDAWSSQTSQAFLDPYSFTHILHGLAFCGLLALLIRGLSTGWRLALAVAIESAWEIIENSNTVWGRSIFVFLATELVLIIWIRDSLLLEILMLIHPVNAIKVWQIGG